MSRSTAAPSRPASSAAWAAVSAPASRASRTASARVRIRRTACGVPTSGVESVVVVPGHPFRCRYGHVPGIMPWSLAVDKLLLVQGIHRLRGGIVVGIAFAADRADRADILQP